MDVPNWRRVLPVLLNHRSPGVSPGTWESRAMSPTGYPGYPTPLRARIEPGPRRRSSVRIGPCRINLSREASEELPEARQIFKTPLESELSGRIRLAVSHEARVCGGNDPCARIQVSKNAIVSASEA